MSISFEGFEINGAPLTRPQKLKQVFAQRKNAVLVRQGKRVYLWGVTDLRQHVGSNRSKIVQVCAALSAQIYQGQDHQQWFEFAVSNGWERLDDLPTHELQGYLVLRSFKYDIWVNRDIKTAVIVIRGTQTKSDWWANLRILTRHIPFVQDHYKQAQALAPRFEQRIIEELGEQAQLISTGHSLGGGLAQQLAYCSEKLNAVVAFAPSPITGYFGTDKALRDRCKQGVHIFRIFEHGEILAFLRLPIRQIIWLARRNPSIKEFRFNFLSGNFVFEHSMGLFAGELIDALDNRPAEPQIVAEPSTEVS